MKNRLLKSVVLAVFLWLFMSIFLVIFANKIIFVTAFSKGSAKSRYDYTEVFFDYLDGIVGDKGLFSNAKEMLLFDKTLNSGELLNDSTKKLAFTPHNKIKNEHTRRDTKDI